jgi:hypothetical protein
MLSDGILSPLSQSKDIMINDLKGYQSKSRYSQYDGKLDIFCKGISKNVLN